MIQFDYLYKKQNFFNIIQVLCRLFHIAFSLNFEFIFESFEFILVTQFLMIQDK